MVISIFFEDHNPPHIHVAQGKRNHAEWIAQIAIADGRVLEGHIPSRDLKLVRKWMRLHQQELSDAWDLARHNHTPSKIKPLRVR